MPVQYSDILCDGYVIAMVAIELPDRLFYFPFTKEVPGRPSVTITTRPSFPYNQSNIPWLGFRFCVGTTMATPNLVHPVENVFWSLLAARRTRFRSRAIATWLRVTSSGRFR
ncbi:hypothetical protein HZ326_11362 [Fusarium oxysporum f. sp. albedinis]|nr:hypothetical protein HZ326_11362 [Fusarium oxysporum f. sp. albedinis]